MTPSEWYKATENEYINKRYIMFGLGGGEYVSEVLNRCTTEVKIIVFEPKESGMGQSDEEYAAFKELSSAGVEVYVEGRMEDNFTNFLYKFIDYSSLQGMIVFKHPDYVNQDTSNVSKYSQSEQLFDNGIAAAEDGIRATRKVKERFGEESFVNMMTNYRALFTSKSLTSFIAKLDTKAPAIIVASGPSLSKNIHLLNRAKGKSVIISADSAVSALLANDIMPDIYVSVDPHKEKKSFEDERIKDIPAIVELTSAIPAIKEGQEHFFLFNRGNDYLESFIDAENIEMHIIGDGGSVANVCFDAAVAMGFSNIIFIGLDLAYTGNKTHVENTARYGMAIDESTVAYVKDIYGNDVKSSGEFTIYRTLIEDKIAACPYLNVVDATEGGALVAGSYVMTFAEAIDKYCINDINVKSIVDASDDLLTEEQRKRLAEHLLNMQNKLNSLSEHLEKSLKNYDEMYMMAKRKQLNKNRLTKIMAENDELSKKINENPVMCYVELLAQEAIHNVQENAYKHNNDIFDEILEAASIGIDYDKGMLDGVKRALEAAKFDTLYIK